MVTRSPLGKMQLPAAVHPTRSRSGQRSAGLARLSADLQTSDGKICRPLYKMAASSKNTESTSSFYPCALTADLQYEHCGQIAGGKSSYAMHERNVVCPCCWKANPCLAPPSAQCHLLSMTRAAMDSEHDFPFLPTKEEEIKT